MLNSGSGLFATGGKKLYLLHERYVDMHMEQHAWFVFYRMALGWTNYLVLGLSILSCLTGPQLHHSAVGSEHLVGFSCGAHISRSRWFEEFQKLL